MTNSIFQSYWFQTYLVPIVFLVIGVLANRLGRKDGDQSPVKNYWAAGTAILLMSLGTTFTELGHPNSVSENILPWVIAFLVILFISIDLDRYGSWIRDENGMPTNQKHIIKGILIPDIGAVVLFAVYRATV